MDALGRSSGAATMISAPTSMVRERQNDLHHFVPESRKRKIEEVEGRPQDDRVRMGLQFNHEGGSSISPSSYRTYSDFPRSSYPSQMPAPATAGRLTRSSLVGEEKPSVIVRTLVEEQTLEQPREQAAVSSMDGNAEGELEGQRDRPVRDRARKVRCRGDWPQPTRELSFPMTE